MSTHYSSNQFESAFVPCRVQNYEIPSNYKEFPSQRKGCTKTIVNDRGHIILQANKKESTNPWGHFIGTWQKPRKPIKLRVKTKFMVHGYHGDSAMGNSRDGTSNDFQDPGVKNLVEDIGKQAQGSTLSPCSESKQSSENVSKSPEPNHSTPVAAVGTSLSTPSSRCASAQTSRSTHSTGSKTPKQCISSAGHTPYSRHSQISPSNELKESNNSSSRPASSCPSVASTPSRPASSAILNKKPLSSGSSRVSSAPTNARFGGSSSRQSDRSLLGSSHSQRVASQSCSRHSDSRQGTGQQSVMSSSQGERVSSPSSYVESRPSSQASVAFTSSTTKSGCKHRGVQCGSHSST